MQHNDYVDFFKDLAIAHKDLRHEEEGEQYPTGKRRSFFRSNGFAEIVQDLGSQVDNPLLLLSNYTGQLFSGNELNVDDIMTGSFMILKRADNIDFQAIDDAKDECKQIATDIIAEMQRLYLDEGRCGPIDNFNLSTVRYEFKGPMFVDFHGIAVYFVFTEQAYHINTIDLDTAFRR